MLMDKKVIVTVGSTFIRESQYTTSKTKNTLTFIDDSVVTTTDRQVTFTLVDSDYVVIQKETENVDAVVDGQTEFDIPLPFDNYLKLGNSLMVFVNQTFIDPSRYVIDMDNSTIMIKNFSDALRKGQTMTFMYFYIANSANRSMTREDVQHPLINERGYLYLNRSDIGHMLNNKLYFMFINGKKINRDNIMNIANNIIRLKADVQTRFNTLILDYTPHIPELAKYKNINSDYDIIMNQVSNEDINKLFNIYTNITDLEEHIVPDTSQEAIINDIIRTHCLANGVNKGLPFVYTYDASTLKHRSVYDLATVINKYVAPGRYTFTVPADVNMLDIRTVSSASRVKPMTTAMQTLGYFTDNDFEFGEVSYIVPTAVADYMDRMRVPTTVVAYSLPRESNNTLPAANDFKPDMKPIRINETASTKGNFRPYFYQKEIIRNVKVHPGMKYKLTIPKGGFAHIAYDIADTDLYQYHLKYRVNFDSDRDATPIYYTGDTIREANNFVDNINTIYSDDFTLSYKQKFTNPGEYYWTCPPNVGEIILTLCSGYKVLATVNDIERYPTGFQFCGYESTDFSVAPLPKVGAIEKIDINQFFDRYDNTYDSGIFNVLTDGAEIHFATDGTMYGSGVYEVGFITPTDKFAIDDNQNSKYRSRFNYLQTNGAMVSISESTKGPEILSHMKVTPLGSYTIYVAQQAVTTGSMRLGKYTNHRLSGVLGMSYKNKVVADGKDTNLYLANTLDASRENIANPKINYSELNTEMKNSELAGDPGVSHVISEEEALQERDKPVFLKELPKIIIDENEQVDFNQINIFGADNIVRRSR